MKWYVGVAVLAIATLAEAADFLGFRLGDTTGTVLARLNSKSAVYEANNNVISVKQYSVFSDIGPARTAQFVFADDTLKVFTIIFHDPQGEIFDSLKQRFDLRYHNASRSSFGSNVVHQYRDGDSVFSLHRNTFGLGSSVNTTLILCGSTEDC